GGEDSPERDGGSELCGGGVGGEEVFAEEEVTLLEQRGCPRLHGLSGVGVERVSQRPKILPDWNRATIVRIHPAITAQRGSNGKAAGPVHWIRVATKAS